MPGSQWGVVMDKGQVALTMHHIGLGQSNVGISKHPGRGAPPESWAWIPARRPGLCRLSKGNFDVSTDVFTERASVCHTLSA